MESLSLKTIKNEEEGSLNNSSYQSALVQYLQEIKQIKILTKEEELELVKQAQDSNEEARNFLITTNLKLVVSIAKKYLNMGLDLEDLIQEGNLGLFKAIDKFEPEKGYRFTTYATYWVKQYIGRAISNKSSVIRIPVYMRELLLKIAKAETAFAIEKGRNPSEEELSKILNLSIEKVIQVRRYTKKVLSLDSPIEDDKDNYTLEEITEKEEEERPELLLIKKCGKNALYDVLDTLEQKEKDVLFLRFGLDGGGSRTLEDTGKLLSTSKERVRQLEKKALRKLRHPSRINILKENVI